MKRLALIAASLVLLSGCSKDTLDGEVTKKEVDPGFTYVQVIPICTSNGKTTTCTPIPYIFTVPTCYRLTVETAEGKEDDGCVTEANYNATDIGEHYVGDDLGKRESKEPK